MVFIFFVKAVLESIIFCPLEYNAAKNNTFQAYKFTREENGKSYESQIQIIHVTDLIAANKIISDHLRVESGTSIYFHGTRTHGDAMHIALSGIKLNRGAHVGNFSNLQSRAFYITQSFDYARSVCSQGHRKEYAIVVFKLPKEELSNFDGLLLEDNKELWLEVVHYFCPHASKLLKKADCRRLEQTHGVLTKDFISGNVTTKLLIGKKETFVPDNTLQFAIKSDRLAKFFSRPSYISLLLYKK